MSARAKLKSETHDLHMQLHRLEVFRDLLNQRLPVDRYRGLVGCLHGYYAPLDPVLSRGAALLKMHLPQCAYVYEPRSPMLVADLGELGASVLSTDRPARCDSPAVLATPGHVLGALYVIEGSTQGGKILCERLDNLFGAGGFAGRSYFQWCAGQDGSRWTQLCDAIDAYSDNAVETENMVVAAKQIFRTLLQWLTDAEDIPAIRERALMKST